MESELGAGLAGLRVVSFESRHAGEMAELIRRYGGTPISAPAMREVPVAENAAAREFLRDLETARVDMFVALTGVGIRTLLSALEPSCPREKLAGLLGRTTLVARGPKSSAALRELGLEVEIVALEPNTWREVLAAIDANGPVAGRSIAVQEYGMTNRELLAGLEARGARVRAIPVYRWDLPADIEPLREAVRELAAGSVAVALFTSATQVDHLMRVAGEMGLADALRESARRTVFASIGPICSEQLRSVGLPVDIEPEHSKMGQLVRAAARRAAPVLTAKRSAR